MGGRERSGGHTQTNQVAEDSSPPSAPPRDLADVSDVLNRRLILGTCVHLVRAPLESQDKYVLESELVGGHVSGRESGGGDGRIVAVTWTPVGMFEAGSHDRGRLPSQLRPVPQDEDIFSPAERRGLAAKLCATCAAAGRVASEEPPAREARSRSALTRCLWG